MLLDQTKKALSGQSRFTLFDDMLPTVCEPHEDFAKFSKQVVIWPLDNDPQSVWKFLSAMSAGVIPVIISGKWPAMKIEKLREQFPRFGYFDGEKITAAENPAEFDNGICLVLMTSGSTGTPQAIATTEDRLEKGIQFIHERQQLENVSSTGILLPVCYSYSLINQLLWAIYYEKQTYINNTLMGPFEPFLYLDRHKTEMVCLVSAQIGLITKIDYSTMPKLGNVKVVNFAGSPFPYANLDDLKILFPSATFMNNYGCTEAMPRLTMREVIDGNEDRSNVGPPIGDIELKIDGSEKVGPIMFKGSSTAIGKITQSGEFEAFPEWINSGDHGYLEDGILNIAGRKDQIVKIQGERFSLLEIEHTIQKLGFDHVMVWLDEAKAKIILVTGGKNKPDINEIRNACKQYLHRHMWPGEMYFIEKWPLNANHKTDRTLIQKWHQDGTLPRY